MEVGSLTLRFEMLLLFSLGGIWKVKVTKRVAFFNVYLSFVHYHEFYVSFHLFLINNISVLPINKKKKKGFRACSNGLKMH